MGFYMTHTHTHTYIQEQAEGSTRCVVITAPVGPRQMYNPSSFTLLQTPPLKILLCYYVITDHILLQYDLGLRDGPFQNVLLIESRAKSYNDLNAKIQDQVIALNILNYIFILKVTYNKQKKS